MLSYAAFSFLPMKQKCILGAGISLPAHTTLQLWFLYEPGILVHESIVVVLGFLPVICCLCLVISNLCLTHLKS